MLVKRILIVALICCATVRENLSASIAMVSPHNFQIQSAEPVIDCSVASSDEDPSFGGSVPVKDERPPEDDGIPVIMEIDLDPEAEEEPCRGDYNTVPVFVSRCLPHKNNVLCFGSFNSFCTLKRLRT